MSGSFELILFYRKKSSFYKFLNHLILRLHKSYYYLVKELNMSTVLDHLNEVINRVDTLNKLGTAS